MPVRYLLARRWLVAAVVAVGVVTAVGIPAAASPGRATAPVRGAGGSGAVPGSYLVVLKDVAVARTAVERTAATLAARHGATVVHRYTAALAGFSVRASAAAAGRLAREPEVDYVEQNRLMRLDGTQPAPPSWGLDRVDQRTLPLDRSFSYPANAGAGVHAYVVDTGIRLSHRDVAGRAVTGIDLVDGGSADDCNGHGSHVAGTLGGTTFGVAKQVRLVAVRVFDCAGGGDVARTVAAVDWITANAVRPAVANLSLGYPSESDPGGSLDAAVSRSIGSGISYVVSAGNDNGDACTKSPARVPAAITVAASQPDDGTWPSSNEGRCTDLFAPGLNVVSAGHNTDTDSGFRSGTSMAAPHVAGAAALILAANPTRTPAQVHGDLVARATPDVLRWVTDDTPNLLLHIDRPPVGGAPPADTGR